MSSKIGRPKVDNPKDCDVKVRFDAKTHEKLLQFCVENNLTKAEAVRQGVNLLLGEK